MTTEPSNNNHLFHLLNLDPEYERHLYKDEAVQACILQHTGETRQRWKIKLAGVMHYNVSPLDILCALPASLSVVILVTSADPAGISEQDSFGLTPLHYACLYGASAKVVRFLITKNPNALKQCDFASQLPLHVACWKNAGLQVIELLLQKYPEAASVPLSDDRLPLHVACSNQASVQVVDLLLEANPRAVEVRESEGGWMPLHYACRNNATTEVIQTLVDAYPSSTTMSQSNGWLGLHLACANDGSQEVVQILLKANPESATKRDLQGYLPLHVACMYEASLQVIALLVQVYEDGTKVQANDGSLPLHLACARQLPLQVIELLVKVYPEGMKVVDKNGRTPLQVSKMVDEKRQAKEPSTTTFQSERNICSNLLCNALRQTRPKTAVPLSLSFLRKCSRKFSTSKNGMGGDGSTFVFRALDMKSCTAFAIKRFAPNVLLADTTAVVKEVEELSRLDHPNLIRLLGYCLPEKPSEPTYLVYELAEGGTLASVLSSDDRSVLGWRKRIRISCSLVSALAYLHSKNLYHESLRPENVYFWEGYTKTLLMDYGNSRLLGKHFRDASVLSSYASPEFLSGQVEYDEPCQIYSVGTMLKTLITGKLPVEGGHPGTTAQSLITDVDKSAGDWDAGILQVFCSLTEGCMLDNRNERPTLHALLELLVQLEIKCSEKITSTSQVLGALLHVEQMNAEKEETNGSRSLRTFGKGPMLTRIASCHCSRNDVRGVMCSSEDGHFCCDKCFGELVNEELGQAAIYCREESCQNCYSAKQIFDHVDERLFDQHINEEERTTFLEGLWARGAKYVSHVQPPDALKALNALATRDPGAPGFPPLCVLCLVTSRRGGSRVPNPFARKRRFLLYFVCAFDFKPTKSAIKISRTRKWLRKVAPALKASLIALDICVSQTTESLMEHDTVAKYMSMEVMDDEIHQFADESWEQIVDVFNLYGRDATGELGLHREHRVVEARTVTDPAYQELSELATTYPDWTKEMKLATNKRGEVAWVKNENVENWKQFG